MEEKKIGKNVVPLWEKLNLTVLEAVEYSGIGENKLRELLKEKNCSFILCVGTKYLVKRKEFERFIEQKEVI